jgi:hypothetical protein
LESLRVQDLVYLNCIECIDASLNVSLLRLMFTINGSLRLAGFLIKSLFELRVSLTCV